MASNESANANVVLTADVSNYTQSINEAESSTQKLVRGVSTLSAAISGVRKAAATRLVIFAAADVGLLAAGVAIASKFEQQLKTLSGVTAAASKNQGQFNASMATYRDGINKIARDSSTSRGEIAQLTTALTQMGVKGPAEVVKVAKTMDQLSKATGESATAMAASLTQFAQQMGTLGNGAASLDRYADSLVKVSSQAGVAASSVASFAQSIAPVARAAGVSATEVIGFSAAFSKAGADGYAAANTFNSILSEITRGVQSGSPDMAKYANLIGVTAGEFEKMNKSESIIQIFEAINSAGPKSLQILDQLGIDGVRAQRAIQAVSSSGNLRKTVYDATGDNSGLTGKAADAAEDNLGSSLSRVQNQFEQIGSTIGEMWIGPLTKVVQLFGTLLSKVMPILDPILKIGSVIAGIVAPIAAVAAALLSIAPIITPLALAITALSGLRALSAGFRGGAGDLRTGDRFQERYVNNQMGPVQKALFNTAAGAGQLANRMGYTPSAAGGGGVGGIIRGAGAYLAQGAGWYFRANENLYNTARLAGTDAKESGGNLKQNLTNAGTALKNMFTSTDGLRKGMDDARTRIAAGVGPAPSLGAAIKGAAGDFVKMGYAAGKMGVALGGSAISGVAGQLGGGIKALGSNLLGGIGGPMALASIGMGIWAMYNSGSDNRNKKVVQDSSVYYSAANEYARALDFASTEVTGFAAAVSSAKKSMSTEEATANITVADVNAAMAPDRKYTSDYIAGNSQEAVMAWMKRLSPDYDPKLFDGLKLDLIQKFGALKAQDMLTEYRKFTGIGQGNSYRLSDQTKEQNQGQITGVLSLDDFRKAGESAGRQQDAFFGVPAGVFDFTTKKANVTEGAQNSINRAFSDLNTAYQKLSLTSPEDAKQLYAGGLREIAKGAFFGAREADRSKSGFNSTVDPIDTAQTLLEGLKISAPSYGFDQFNESIFRNFTFTGTAANIGSNTGYSGVDPNDLVRNFYQMLQDHGGEGIQRYIKEQGGIEGIMSAQFDPNKIVNKTVDPVIAKLSASDVGKKIVDSPIIGNALTRLNDPKANAAAVGELVQLTKGFAGGLNDAIAGLQGFKNNINDTSSRLYQLYDAAQRQLMSYRSSNRGFMSMAERGQDTVSDYNRVVGLMGVSQKALLDAQSFLNKYSSETLAGRAGGRIRRRSGINIDIASEGVSNTSEQLENSKQEIQKAYDDYISMLNNAGISQRNFYTQMGYQQADYQKQLVRSNFSFELSMGRQKDDFRRQESRSITNFNLQRRYAEEDFQRQRKYSLQDHQREIKNMVSQQMQTIYNPYQTVQAQGGMSKTMLFSNLRDQTRLLKDQRKNLNLFKKLFPNEAAARNAIDMLDLTNPANAGQLDELVRTMSSQDAASLTQIYGQRRKATADIVANEDNFGYRTQEEGFKRSLKRQDEEFERQLNRQEKAFKLSLRLSREDFARSVRHARADFLRNAEWAEADFQESMGRAQTAFELSITDMVDGTSHLYDGFALVNSLMGDGPGTTLGTLKDIVAVGQNLGIRGPIYDQLVTLSDGANNLSTSLGALDGKTVTLGIVSTPETDKTLTQANALVSTLRSINGSTYSFTIKPKTDGTTGTAPGNPETDKYNGGNSGRVVITSAAGSGPIQVVDIRNITIGKRWGGKVGHPYDTVPVMAQKGEWFHRAESSNYYGDDIMSGINDMRINRSALKQAMQGNYASTVAYKGTDNGSITNINASTNFNGEITVQAQDPNEMARKLASKQRMAALTRRK